MELLHDEIEDWALSVVPGITAEQAHDLFTAVQAAVAVAVEMADLRDLGRWTPQQASEVVAATEAMDALLAAQLAEGVAHDDQPLPGTGEGIALALAPLFGFLVDIGRWHGTQADLDVVDSASSAVEEQVLRCTPSSPTHPATPPPRSPPSRRCLWLGTWCLCCAGSR